MAGVLLDTHALYWLVKGADLSNEALVAIGQGQAAGNLYVSPITAWELSLAVRKPNNAPQLGDATVSKWFRAAVRETTAKVAPITHRIALEAAEVVAVTGHKDPGDCYLIATARIKKIPFVTRDKAIAELCVPGYLEIIAC